MAHRSTIVYWECVAQELGAWKGETWLLWSGPPGEEGSQIIFDFQDGDYRKFIKSLPRFKDGEVYTGRLSFVPAAPRKAKKSSGDATVESDEAED